MSVIYVAANGNDNALGTITAPIATLARLNELLADGGVALGDSAFLRRGDTFSGVLAPLSGYTFQGRYLTLGAYDVGPMPKVSAYKILNTAGGWTLYEAGIWRIDLTNEATHTGFTKLATSNIGHLLINGVIFGNRLWSTGELKNPWDFYCDNSQYLYVKASANPTTLATDIRAAPNTTLCPRRSSTILAGLDLHGSGGHGIAGTATAEGQGAYSRVIGCRIRQIGGANLSGTTRYGNGIQDYIGTAHAVSEYNHITDAYDTAYTMQGTYVEGETGSKWEDCHFRFNVTARCSQNLEFWSQGPSGGWVGCTVDNNRCFSAGEGWGSSVRKDPENNAHLLFHKLDLPLTDLQINKNIFYGGSHSAGYIAATAVAPNAIKRKENIVVLPTTAPVSRVTGGATNTIEEGYTWATAESVEQGSQFLTLPNHAPASGTDLLEQAIAQIGAQQGDHNASYAARNNTAANTEAALSLSKAALFLADGSGDTQTGQSSTGEQYAHIASLAINGEFALSELLLLYECASAGTSAENGGRAMGFMRLQLDAQKTPKAALDVTEIIGFGKGTSAIKRSDIYLVVTEANAETHKYEVQLWVYLRWDPLESTCRHASLSIL